MYYIHYQPSGDLYLEDDTEYGNVETIVDLDVVLQNEKIQMTEAVDSTVEKIGAVLLYKSNKYKKYTQDQIEWFICVKQEEGLSVSKAAQFNGTVLPGNNPRKTNNKAKKLFPQHSEFLIELFDNNPSIVLEEARARLYEAFSGLEISVVALYKHIVEKCALSTVSTAVSKNYVLFTTTE